MRLHNSAFLILLLLFAFSKSSSVYGGETKLGGTIVFIRHGDVWNYDFSSGKETQLTRDGTCEQPAIHPEGKKVLYISYRDNYKEYKEWGNIKFGQIYEVDVSTQKSRKVKNLPECQCFYPCYSPDGKEIIFTRANHRKEQSKPAHGGFFFVELCVFDSESGEMRILEKASNFGEDMEFCWPAFTDNSKMIYFINYWEGGSDAGMIPMEGGKGKGIKISDLSFAFISFFPDSTKMAFISRVYRSGGESSLYLKNMKTGKMKKIIKDVSADLCRFSPDGQFIVLGHIFEEGPVKIINLDGVCIKEITTGSQAVLGEMKEGSEDA